MSLTDTKTEKVPGRVTHVYIGYDSTHGVDVSSGIKTFEYRRVHDAKRRFVAGSKTASAVQQPQSNFTWRLEFLSDSRAAWFATDVDDAGGSQYALDDNGDSNVIEYFRVIVPIEDGAGANKTRTYVITNGYCLRNGARIGDDEDSIYWYEGDAEEITYSDA